MKSLNKNIVFGLISIIHASISGGNCTRYAKEPLQRNVCWSISEYVFVRLKPDESEHVFSAFGWAKKYFLAGSASLRYAENAKPKWIEITGLG